MCENEMNLLQQVETYVVDVDASSKQVVEDALTFFKDDHFEDVPDLCLTVDGVPLPKSVLIIIYSPTDASIFVFDVTRSVLGTWLGSGMLKRIIPSLQISSVYKM